MKAQCKDCCSPVMDNTDACGCCDGVDVLTPLSTYNRPGLSEINYRIGTHASFLESMQARLTGYRLEKVDKDENSVTHYPLQGLRTRDKSDASMALLDAWASVADVLTFYQERIANEGYLGTATERRSIVEMARLVGYTPRPGVSSSVFLAYNIEDNFKEETLIPKGTRAQSIPAPGELPQSFETSEDLKARAEWNDLKPRKTKPQNIYFIRNERKLYLKGINTGLKKNDPLLIGIGETQPEIFMISEVILKIDEDKTLVLLGDNDSPAFDDEAAILDQVTLINQLNMQASLQPANSRQLKRNLTESFAVNNFQTDAKSAKLVGAKSASHAVLKNLVPQLKDTYKTSLANANLNATADNKIRVYKLNVKAKPFAHNTPLQQLALNNNNVMTYTEWQINNPKGVAEQVALFTESISGRQVSFSNQSTGNIIGVNWDFGDGSSSGVWSPEHTYASDDTFTVTLTLTTSSADVTSTRVITVQEVVII